MTDDTERFITAIRDTIEAQLLSQEGDGFHNPMVRGGGGELLIDGYVDTDALARAVHAAVVAHLGPPF